MVLAAQPSTVYPESAAGDGAFGQLGTAPDRPPGISEELGHIRAAAAAPPDRVAVTEASLRDHAVAAAHAAFARDEDRVVRGGAVDLVAELGANAGQQLLQQPRPAGNSLDRRHNRTSRPVNQPAPSSA